MERSERSLFSLASYRELLNALAQEGYEFCGYDNWRCGAKRVVILRHDVDYSLSRAVPMAALEAELGLSSTYFILVRGDFYNVFSRQGACVLESLQDMGHSIGLHFDETLYGENEDPIEAILHEAALLESATGAKVKSVSMHRPSKRALSESWVIPGIENAYSHEYFHGFTYLSDSRMRWREDVFGAIRSGDHAHLQVLTHPFWYCERPLDLAETLDGFIESASYERTLALEDNFSRLDEEIGAARIRRAKVATDLKGVSIGTDRLVLRHLRMADAADMFEYASDPDVCQYLSWGPYTSIEQASSWIDAKLSKANPTDVLFGVEERASGKLIGVVRAYNIDSPADSAEVSYILNPAYQGKGYMTEAVRSVVSLCFDTLGLSSVVAYCVEENTSSSGLMQRIGMHRDLSYSEPLVIKGLEYKSIRYRINKEQQR